MRAARFHVSLWHRSIFDARSAWAGPLARSWRGEGELDQCFWLETLDAGGDMGKIIRLDMAGSSPISTTRINVDAHVIKKGLRSYRI